MGLGFLLGAKFAFLRYPCLDWRIATPSQFLSWIYGIYKSFSWRPKGLWSFKEPITNQASSPGSSSSFFVYAGSYLFVVPQKSLGERVLKGHPSWSAGQLIRSRWSSYNLEPKAELPDFDGLWRNYIEVGLVWDFLSNYR